MTQPPTPETALAGATDVGPEFSYPADAGEFAARWNAATPERREEVVRRLVRDSESASTCVMQDHQVLLSELRRADERIRGLCADFASEALGNTWAIGEHR